MFGICIDMKEGNREHQTGNQELGTGTHCHGGDQVGGGWYHGGSPSLSISALDTKRSPCPFVWLYQPIYIGKYIQDCGRTTTTMDTKSGECFTYTTEWVVPPF